MHLTPENISNKKILISPLDWGMGHTTRCVGLIKTLLSNSNEIIFAGNNLQIQFITREFPDVKTIFLEGYNISLDSKKSTYWQVFSQINKISKALKHEQEFAEKISIEEKIDIIISDNRYGFYSKNSTNILITHQLNLQIPKWKSTANKKLKQLIEKFDICWIPDSVSKPICCELTNANLSIPKIHIGHLSRFNKGNAVPLSWGEGLGVRYENLAIISGPEPERSRFAKNLIAYLKKQTGKTAIVGIGGKESSIDFFENPSTQELEHLIHQSETIISRAGYTTIMEMISLEKKAILIPTPGQYEQEYLAEMIKSDWIIFKTEKEFFG